MMKEIKALVCKKEELEDILQNELNDKCLRVYGMGEYYYAGSDANELDGREIDNIIGEYLHMKECIHFKVKRGNDEYAVFIEPEKINEVFSESESIKAWIGECR